MFDGLWNFMFGTSFMLNIILVLIVISIIIGESKSIRRRDEFEERREAHLSTTTHPSDASGQKEL